MSKKTQERMDFTVIIHINPAIIEPPAPIVGSDEAIHLNDGEIKHRVRARLGSMRG